MEKLKNRTFKHKRKEDNFQEISSEAFTEICQKLKLIAEDIIISLKIFDICITKA